jgi:hypothetical protein
MLRTRIRLLTRACFGGAQMSILTARDLQQRARVRGAWLVDYTRVSLGGCSRIVENPSGPGRRQGEWLGQLFRAD